MLVVDGAGAQDAVYGSCSTILAAFNSLISHIARFVAGVTLIGTSLASPSSLIGTRRATALNLKLHEAVSIVQDYADGLQKRYGELTDK